MTGGRLESSSRLADKVTADAGAVAAAVALLPGITEASTPPPEPLPADAAAGPDDAGSKLPTATPRSSAIKERKCKAPVFNDFLSNFFRMVILFFRCDDSDDEGSLDRMMWLIIFCRPLRMLQSLLYSL